MIYKIVVAIKKDNTEDNAEIILTAYVLCKCSGKQFVHLTCIEDGIEVFRVSFDAKDLRTESVEELSMLLDNPISLIIPPKSPESSD